MVNKEVVISEIETFIRINGDRFKLYYIKHGMRGEMLPFRKISQIEAEHGTLKSYINHFIDVSKPNSIEVVTKKPNGSSHGINPTKAVFEVKESQPTNINHSQPILSTVSNLGLSGVEKIYTLETNLLNRELQKETNRADRYENLYHDLREKHFDLEKDHKLFKDKTELEREKERLQNENSLSSVIKEVKPELFGLLGAMMQKPTSIPEQSTTIQGVESEKVSLLSETLMQLPIEMQNEAIEVLIRYLNSDAKNRGGILNNLRESTEELNEQIKEIIND